MYLSRRDNALLDVILDEQITDGLLEKIRHGRAVELNLQTLKLLLRLDLQEEVHVDHRPTVRLRPAGTADLRLCALNDRSRRGFHPYGRLLSCSTPLPRPVRFLKPPQEGQTTFCFTGSKTSGVAQFLHNVAMMIPSLYRLVVSGHLFRPVNKSPNHYTSKALGFIIRIAELGVGISCDFAPLFSVIARGGVEEFLKCLTHVADAREAGKRGDLRHVQIA